ncbi:MAG: DUF3047 domain-containing protein, partial [Gammaproteobacteria bacterium]
MTPVFSVARCLLCLVVFLLPAGAAENPHQKNRVGDFSTATLDAWAEKSFVGKTDYTLVEEGTEKVLQAFCDKSASILYREIDIDLLETPWLNWSWKISSTYGDIDEKNRKGDDYPARIYVVIKTGIFPWNTFALNYVWSSSSAEGTSWKNPYTGNASMLAVQSGEKEIGQWVNERRNVLADIQQYIDKDISSLSGVAIM